MGLKLSVLTILMLAAKEVPHFTVYLKAQLKLALTLLIG